MSSQGQFLSSEANFFQLFIMCHMLKSAYHLGHLLMDPLQYVNVFFTLGILKLGRVFHLQPPKR